MVKNNLFCLFWLFLILFCLLWFFLIVYFKLQLFKLNFIITIFEMIYTNATILFVVPSEDFVIIFPDSYNYIYIYIYIYIYLQ